MSFNRLQIQQHVYEQQKLQKLKEQNDKKQQKNCEQKCNETNDEQLNRTERSSSLSNAGASISHHHYVSQNPHEPIGASNITVETTLGPVVLPTSTYVAGVTSGNLDPNLLSESELTQLGWKRSTLTDINAPTPLKPSLPMPERFLDPSLHAQLAARQHPLYRTAAHVHGYRPPAQQEMPNKYYGNSHTFTNTFKGNNKQTTNQVKITHFVLPFNEMIVAFFHIFYFFYFILYLGGMYRDYGLMTSLSKNKTNVKEEFGYY
jgi:hypothetical protein